MLFENIKVLSHSRSYMIIFIILISFFLKAIDKNDVIQGCLHTISHLGGSHGKKTKQKRSLLIFLKLLQRIKVYKLTSVMLKDKFTLIFVA